MKEFPQDLYDVIKILTVISDVNNSGIFSHMSLSHKGTFGRNLYFLFYFVNDRKLNVYMLITT